MTKIFTPLSHEFIYHFSGSLMIKFLNAQIIVPIEIHRQLCPGLWPHTARRSTHFLQEFNWEVFNHHLPHIHSHPAISIISYNSRNSCPISISEWQRGGDECHSSSNLRRQSSTTQGYKSWSHGMTNISIPEVNMLKNISTLATTVPINLSIKLGFISVKGSR